MTSRKHLFALGSGLLLGVTGVVHADDTALQAKVDALTAKVAQLEGQKSESWLNQQRADEVKALVREVLADADTRASLLENGMTAGHNGKNFFLASEDGNFRLNVGGQIQIRYIANFRDDQDQAAGVAATDVDEHESGFQLRRVKLRFDGHIGSPRLMYTVQIANVDDGSTEALRVDEATVAYQLMDNLVVSGGRYKDTFLREDMTDSRYQLAIERSVVSALFGMGRVEGIAATYTNDMFRANLNINDGARSGDAFDNSGNGFSTATDFQNDDSDFSVTGRLDVKLMGSWDQIRDFSSWSGQETSLVLGAAVNYDDVDTGLTQAAGNPDFTNPLGDSRLSWTVDGSFEMAGLNVFAAIVGEHSKGTENSGDNGFDNYGAIAQVGYMVIPDKLEPYVRFEYITLDDDLNTFGTTGPQDTEILTLGANYYFRQHAAKFSADVVYAFDSISSPNLPNGGLISGTGLLADSNNDGDQVVLRAQFQLLF